MQNINVQGKARASHKETFSGFKIVTAVLTFSFRLLSSPLLSLFVLYFFFSCWSFSSLILVGNVLGRAFRILGLDERKC